MKNLKSVILFLFVSLVGCNSPKSIDGFLDDYEKLVVKWEEKSQEKPLTQQDYAQISADALKLNAYATELKDKKLEDFTAEQQARMLGLVGRLSAVMSSFKVDESSMETEEKTEDK